MWKCIICEKFEEEKELVAKDEFGDVVHISCYEEENDIKIHR